MVRFLIIEDVPETREQLEKLFANDFPGAVIDTAETVTEALRLIEQSAAQKRPYDIAVQDFKLPLEKGYHPEVDVSTCDLIRKATPTTFIVHITAWPNDPAVLMHLTEAHLDLGPPSACLISKLDADWAEKLMLKAKAYLYGTRIEQQMARLFGPTYAREVPKKWPMQLVPVSKGSVTHELAALQRDIEAHWHDLDARLQQRVSEFFYVNTKVTPVRVSVLHSVDQKEEK